MIIRVFFKDGRQADIRAAGIEKKVDSIILFVKEQGGEVAATFQTTSIIGTVNVATLVETERRTVVRSEPIDLSGPCWPDSPTEPS